MTIIKLNLEVNLADSCLGNILSTAIEGGSGYWASIVAEYNPAFKEDIFKPAYLSAIFKDTEDSTVGGKVTIADIAKGIENILNPDFKVNDRLKTTCFQLLSDPDDADFDADDADCIIQAFLFNEIIYS